MTELRYFTHEEMVSAMTCQATGEMMPEALWDWDAWRALDELRHRSAFPFVITSGFRSAHHPKEAAKRQPGQHNKGHAFDVAVESGGQRFAIVREAIALGWSGIGVGKSFVHVDKRNLSVGEAPVMWEYS